MSQLINRRLDACPNGCVDTEHAAPVVVAPTTWATTTHGASGTYRCPVCRRPWTTSYRAEIEHVEFA